MSMSPSVVMWESSSSDLTAIPTGLWHSVPLHSVSDARDKLRSGEVTAVELTDACLDAIEGADALNAFVHHTPDLARAQAAAADALIDCAVKDVEGGITADDSSEGN